MKQYRVFILLLLVMTSVLNVGCETTKRMLKSAELALSDPAEREKLQKELKETMDRESKVLIQEFQKIKQDFQKLITDLTAKVKKKWGQKEVRIPERTVYVKYTQNYRSRAIADFDHGTVTVETLDDKDPQGSLKTAIVTTLLTTNDPRTVDLFSDKGVTLANGREPYLLGLVQDQDGKAVRTSEQAERFAVYLIEKRSRTRTVQADEGQKTARYVKIDMVPNFENKKAEKYRAAVSRFAEQYKVSPSLVFAIIRTESNFNPFAVSSIPAYGLMQLVPISGGRDAYRRAKGADQVPSPEYLFDPDNNIELGTAFLNVLAFNQLEQVTNPVSREYCVIAAYNTGPGNVLRTFSRSRATALTAINSLEPGALYDKLRTSLPYEETRQYISKVVTYRKRFLGNTVSEP